MPKQKKEYNNIEHYKKNLKKTISPFNTIITIGGSMYAGHILGIGAYFLFDSSPKDWYYFHELVDNILFKDIHKGFPYTLGSFFGFIGGCTYLINKINKTSKKIKSLEQKLEE